MLHESRWALSLCGFYSREGLSGREDLRAGVPTYTELSLLPDELQPPLPRAHIHLCDEFFRAFDINRAAYRNDVSFRIATSAFRSVHARLHCEGIDERRLVAMHTGPTWLTKEWLGEEWNSLVRMLTSKCNVEVIQIGEDRYSVR